MNCTALSCSSSSTVVRKSLSLQEVSDTYENIKIAKFLKYLLRSRFWLLKSKNEDSGTSLMQSWYSIENQSMVNELEYAKAVEDLQTCAIMKCLIHSKVCSFGIISDVVWKLLTSENLDPSFMEYFRDWKINDYLESLQETSLKLQNLTDQTSEVLSKKEIAAKNTASILSSTINHNECNKFDELRDQKCGRLKKKIRQMRIMQTIMTNLVGSFKINDDQFSQVLDLLDQVGEIRSWSYYCQKI